MTSSSKTELEPCESSPSEEWWAPIVITPPEWNERSASNLLIESDFPVHESVSQSDIPLMQPIGCVIAYSWIKFTPPSTTTLPLSPLSLMRFSFSVRTTTVFGSSEHIAPSAMVKRKIFSRILGNTYTTWQHSQRQPDTGRIWGQLT